MSNFFILSSFFSLIPQNEKLELASWHLPPKYMELYDKSNDILKELYIKCKF
jgi:hypothetical protein